MEISSLKAGTVDGGQLTGKETETWGNCGNLCKVTWLESRWALLTEILTRKKKKKIRMQNRFSANSGDEDDS